MTSLPRDFKGIWIPKEIWLDQTLTYFEKILLAEIHSLNGEEGCYASNEYFCNFFNERERKIQDALAKLKAKGYVYQESFDGRTRVLRTNLTPENDKSLFSTSDLSKIDTPPLSKIDTPFTGSHTLYENKDNNKLSCSVPQGLKIVKLNSRKERIEISSEEIFCRSLRERKDWTTAEISEAWAILSDCPNPVNDGFAMIDGIIKNLRLKNKQHKTEQKKPKTNNAPPKRNDPAGKNPWAEELKNKGK